MGSRVFKRLLEGNDAAAVLMFVSFGISLARKSHQHGQAAVVNAHLHSLVGCALHGRIVAGAVLDVTTFVIVSGPGGNQLPAGEVGGPFGTSVPRVVDDVVHRATRAAGINGSVGRLDSEFGLLGNHAAADLAIGRLR